MVTRHRKSLVVAVAGLALALTPLVAGCSDDGPDRADVVAKIRSDPRMEGVPDPVVNCLADWYMEDASAQVRDAFLNGTTPPENNDPAVLECLKGAS